MSKDKKAKPEKKKKSLNPFGRKKKSTNEYKVPEPYITASQVVDILKEWQQEQAPPPRKGTDPFAIGFFVGILAGGIAAGVLTPVNGKHIRAQLQQQGHSATDKAQNVTLQVKTTAQEVMNRGQAGQ
jgi:hypothetical protein